ncbi:MAG: alpha/beta hydrolase [Candidatus Eiseniibacteriota bacterium]
MRDLMKGIAAACAVAGVVCAALPATAADEVRTIASRPGVTERVLFIRPGGPPAASVILFVGGPGKAGLKMPWPAGHRGGNFLFHNADRFVADGLLVAVVDAPSDHEDGLWDWRTSADHAADIAAVIAALRAEAKVPVWLIGTSMGTLSAANGAARLKSGGPDGVVLTSSVTQKSRQSEETVGTVRLEDIAVPVLIVHHEHDGCRASPYAGAEALMDRLRNSPKHEFMAFDGGATPKSGPCDPQAPHGYWGIGYKVVDAIAGWIKTAR